MLNLGIALRPGIAAVLRPGTAALRPGIAVALRPGIAAALRPGIAAALRPGMTSAGISRGRSCIAGRLPDILRGVHSRRIIRRSGRLARLTR